MITPTNILIVRTDRIGDVVLSLPLAEIIKKHFPECRITFLLREYTKSLAKGNPYIDQVLTLKESEAEILFYDNVKLLSNGKYDSVIIVYPTFITSLIIFFSGIRYRIGTGYRWYSLLFNIKIFEHRKYAKRNELEYNVNMLSIFGIHEQPLPGTVNFHIKSDEVVTARITEELKQEGVDLLKPVIIVHPGSGGSAVDLPLDKFKELVSLIYDNFNIKVLITGTEVEKYKCDSISVYGKSLNLCGRYIVEELKSLIFLSDIFIANSTGPLHIAAAMGKYVIGFYPHIKACSPVRWGPYTEKRLLYTPGGECKDCAMEQCASIECMNSIDVHEIFAGIEKLYKLVLK